MKYFSLLSGQDVHPAPGKKIIPSEEYTTLHEASEILHKVKIEAGEYKREVVKESELIKDQAFQEGFQEALNSLNHHIFKLDEELKQLREDIQKKILPLTIKATRRLIGDELQIHPDRIVDIILNSLKPVTQHKKIILYVSKADLEQLEANKPRIKAIFEHLESLSIRERADLESGDCIIETEAGIVNAQLENMLRSLEAVFESFMKK
jgi:type III secretion protein L